MSVASEIIACFLCLSGASREIDEKTFYRQMRREAIRNAKGDKSLPFFLGVRGEKGVYCGMDYFLFIPDETDTSKAVMYLHGSGYMSRYQRVQLRFAADLARDLHAKVYFPLYPKLPNATALSCSALLNNFYVFLRKKGEVLLIGDSSGGALGLSLANLQPSVRSVIAISPWVRLPIGEEGREVESDRMLSLSKLEYTAGLWRGGVDRRDPRVSPIYGDYGGKDILLIAGEREIFRPDIREFFRIHSEQGATVTYLEGRGQQHCYPLMPTPEGKSARKEILCKMRAVLYGDKR